MVALNKMSIVAALVLCACAVSAVDSGTMNRLKHLQRNQTQDHSFKAPAADACRSPCPAINTLANHGYLPRDGKGVTIQMLSDAFQKQLGADEAFGGGFAKLAGKKFIAINNAKTKKTGDKFDLCDLKTRFDAKPLSGVQHDGSMTRADTATQAELGHPNKPYIQKGLDWLKKNHGVTDFITLDNLIELRQHIWAESQKAKPNNPGWKKQKVIGMAETLLLLKVLGGQDGKDDKISVEYFKSFLMDEKFPASWPLKRNGVGGSKPVGLGAFPGAIVDWAGFNVAKTVQDNWDGFKQWASPKVKAVKDKLAGLFK